jgi:hypothetical protein
MATKRFQAFLSANTAGARNRCSASPLPSALAGMPLRAKRVIAITTAEDPTRRVAQPIPFYRMFQASAGLRHRTPRLALAIMFCIFA